MCGIVGLFLKDPKLEPRLGAMLTDMLITMTDRGPDSAGIAIYGRHHDGMAKLTVQSPVGNCASRPSLTPTILSNTPSCDARLAGARQPALFWPHVTDGWWRPMRRADFSEKHWLGSVPGER